eukprot:g21532.t1
MRYLAMTEEKLAQAVDVDSLSPHCKLKTEEASVDWASPQPNARPDPVSLSGFACARSHKLAQAVDVESLSPHCKFKTEELLLLNIKMQHDMTPRHESQ